MQITYASPTLRSLLIAGACFALLSACGGGGSNSSAIPNPSPSPPPNSGPSWTSGVYAPASQFKDRCQIVRTGVDIEGFPFPDMLGSTLLENFWLRSWTNETYLWNTEVIDRNPANYANRLQYFDLLRTTALTASGKDKDEFHFSQPTADYLEQRNSAPTAGYGASYGVISATVPRDFRIQYTEPGSPAAQKVAGVTNLPRGARILEVDGVDLVNANTQAQINTLNNGLYPATAGEMHTFVVRDDGAALNRTVMLISADIATSAVNDIKIISTATGDVGYALINTFSPFASEADIVDAITTMQTAGVADAILDLRYNGGGLVAVSSQLAHMIAGNAQTNGKTFERLQFNAAAGNRDPVTGQINSPIPFLNTALGFSLPNGTPLPALNLNRVFILTTDETCSASESVINGLRGIDIDVVLIGGTTCGKPYGFYPEDNCGETYYTIQFQGVNHKSFGAYTDGFAPQNSSDAFSVKAPGCVVLDDFSHELGDEAEALLAAALNYRATASCPALPVMSATSRVAASTSEVQIDMTPVRNIMDSNRDMTMPNQSGPNQSGPN